MVRKVDSLGQTSRVVDLDLRGAFGFARSLILNSLSCLIDPHAFRALVTWMVPLAVSPPGLFNPTRTKCLNSPQTKLLPLVAGNSKLGPSVWQYSLPTISTCPGRTALCSKACYATKGSYLYANVERRLTFNDEHRLSDDWISQVRMQIRLYRIREVRIHTAGDFDTAAYIRNWCEVIRNAPRTLFWAYTRSWCVPELLPELDKLSRLANMQLWFSCDRETGVPPRRTHVRRAYLSTEDSDIPRYRVDLVFRSNRRTKQVRLGGALVCPAERVSRSKNSTSPRLTCDQCRLCMDRVQWLDEANDKAREPKQASKPEVLVPCT